MHAGSMAEIQTATERLAAAQSARAVAQEFNQSEDQPKKRTIPWVPFILLAITVGIDFIVKIWLADPTLAP